MNETGKMVPGNHPRIGSMRAISVARLRQQDRGSGRFNWDENGRWIEEEVPDLPTRGAEGFREREGAGILTSSENVNMGGKRKIVVDPLASYASHSRPERAGV
jgi:hypothetical protein